MSLCIQYILTTIEEKRISMDNRSGEQNDRIYKLISYLLPKEAVLHWMWYGIFDRVYKRNHFKWKSCADKHSTIFKHVSVSCIKWCVYKKYTFRLPLGFWKQFLSATTCKMIHFWEKDREERMNFEGSLKVRTVHCRPTTFWFYRRLFERHKYRLHFRE